MKTLTLTESIVETLRHSIIIGDLKAGQKLNETKLTCDLGVSSVPLREAFRILENERLVAQIPRKGSFVTKVSLEDCREVFTVRVMIECFTWSSLKSHIHCFLRAIEDHRRIFFLDGNQDSGGFELAKPLDSSLEGFEKPWD
jgi:DNA-binding GntR family transcriptional regulator